MNESAQFELPGENKKETVLTDREREHILELEYSIGVILEKLKSEIEEGSYNLILGDDTSGRIPTLIVSKVLQEIYKEKGFKNPLTRFVAGSSKIFRDKDIEQKEIDLEHYFSVLKKNLIKRNDDQNKEKVLVVTDSIHKGTSISILINGLKKNGLKADVAAVGVTYPNIIESLENKWGGKIAYGIYDTPSIYEDKRLSGVKKNDRELFSVSRTSLIRDKKDADSELEALKQQAVVNEVREELVPEVVSYLLEKYYKEKVHE